MPKTTKPTEAPTPPESFEASTERLATIVESLERGDLPLERALALFEEGVRLARDAQARIEGAEKRVEELLGFDAHGKPTTRPLPSPASSDDEVDAS
jgi:exodeoxyribonuclease VII small subunit